MLEKLLITGAAGGLGKISRDMLGHIAKTTRLSDIVTPDDLPEGADFVECNLADEQAVDKLVEGCDGILHLGGVSRENTFGKILDGNIIGIHNLYEAARKHGHPRIFVASSNHAVGFYKQDERLHGGTPHKPDGWYGISKSFAEAVALMYYHKFGQQSALVRIGSCFPEPVDHRMLATWLAPEDFVTLVERIFFAPRLGCPVIYGVSDNEAQLWDNSSCAYLGWRPKHSSAKFAEKVRANCPMPASDDASAVYHGGNFVNDPIMKD